MLTVLVCLTPTPSAANTTRDELYDQFLSLTRELPVYDDMECGNTGYLDKTKPEDLTASAMMGTDEYDRQFLAIKLQDDEDTWVEVVHQRYTGEPLLVAAGGNTICGGALQERNMITLRFLLAGHVIDGVRMA